MEAYAAACGEWNEYYANYEYVSLENAARRVRFDWPGPAHRAVADCLATRAVWHYLGDESLRRDVAASEEAAGALRHAEWAAHLTRERFERYMTAFWLRWLRLRSPETRPGQRDTEAVDAYHRVFTGYSLAVWEKLNSPAYRDLPRYRRRQAIPAHLKPMSALQPATPRWICAELPPAAVFVSESGKTFCLLFSVNAIGAIRARYPKRYDDWSQVPAALASKTQLRQQGLHVDRLGLRPVAEVRHMTPRGAVFVPLYRRPLTVVASARETRTRGVAKA